MKGNLLGRSVEMTPFNSSTEKTVEPTWWFQSMWLRGGGRGGSDSGYGAWLLVDWMPCRVRCILPMTVGIYGSRCLKINLLVRQIGRTFWLVGSLLWCALTSLGLFILLLVGTICIVFLYLGDRDHPQSICCSVSF